MREDLLAASEDFQPEGMYGSGLKNALCSLATSTKMQTSWNEQKPEVRKD